jgi:hypothetical protein
MSLPSVVVVFERGNDRTAMPGFGTLLARFFY